MKDFPADQASRWSSDSNIPPQVLILEKIGGINLYCGLVL